jgi:phosphatidylserine decarboxylase
LQNDRLSLQWTHPELGRVWMIFVGAMAVSGIRLELGKAGEQWLPLPNFKKGDRLGGFELGSSVLLIVEKPGKLLEGFKKVQPGFDLLRS